jgi:hypothetical protein
MRPAWEGIADGSTIQRIIPHSHGYQYYGRKQIVFGWVVTSLRSDQHGIDIDLFVVRTLFGSNNGPVTVEKKLVTTEILLLEIYHLYMEEAGDNDGHHGFRQGRWERRSC